MKKRLISMITSMTMLLSSAGTAVFPAVVQAATDQTRQTKQMEYLDRGLTAVRTDAGIYLSWRLLGTEPMSQTYDIYRDGKIIQQGIDATNYTDAEGFSYSKYRVVPAGEEMAQCKEAEVWQQNYIDIPLNRPEGGVTKDGESYTYSVNDTSVGDVDGDGQYEYIIKWDPSNAKDNSNHGYTGNVLLDCYKMDGTQLWRIDLGINIRAGAHYTQFIVYDFDGDGKAEMALRTAPGSKDGAGKYVSDAGISGLEWGECKNTDDLRQGGSKKGHIIKGPDWLTVFNGETGAAMQTVNYYPQRGSVSSWGDNYGGRSERYLAGVAYLDGKTPSLIMCRGYYEKAAMSAWNWDGTNLTMQWGQTYSSDKSTLYGQGTHSLSVADVDNDGFDEVVFGSAVMDHNGTVLNSTGHGHGDALHVSDFNNDGEQEIMMVHEEKTYYKTWGAEVRKGADASILAKVAAGSDCGRGVMANVDDDYAVENPDKGQSLFWSAADMNLYDTVGNIVTRTVTTTDNGSTVTKTENVTRPAEYNFFAYWDGDLSRELLDKNRIVKFSVENGSQRLETFSGVHANNSSKATPALSGDLFGDWREEVAYGTDDNKALRIYTTITPTEYKIPTLMHDSQYRCAIAWQNVAYNQPPHTSYYIGSLALAGDKKTLSPAAGMDRVEFAAEPDQTVIPPDMEETVVYDADSFNSGTGDFEGGKISSQTAPYGNTLDASSTATLNFNFIETTPDPNATPTPAPTPTPKPLPTPLPLPTNAPAVIAQNDFSSATGTLMSIQTTESEPYTGLDGLTLYIGARGQGPDVSTYWAGENGMLKAVSGKFATASRGPRMQIVTPEIPAGGTATVTMKVNAASTQCVYYNDSTATLAGSTSETISTEPKLPLTADGSTWDTVKVTLSEDNGTITRTIYVNDEVAATDNKAEMPVFWTYDSASNTSVYFDDLSVTTQQELYPDSELRISSFEFDGNKAKATLQNYSDQDVSADLYFAVYNGENTLVSVSKQGAEVAAKYYVDIETDELAVPEGGYAKAFLWDANMQAYTENISSAMAAAASNIATQYSSGGAGGPGFTMPPATEAPGLNTEGTYKVVFDYKPGASVKFTDANGNNLMTLSKESGGALKYQTASNEAKSVHSTLTASEAWFHVELLFDFMAKTVDISVMDYTNNGTVKAVYAVPFTGVDGFLSKMTVTKGYLDNLKVSEVQYNIPRSLVNIYAKDAAGNALEGAVVSIGGKSLVTDGEGHAAIKLNSGEYNYSITKAAYKGAKGTVDASKDAQIDAVLNEGENRNVYVSYLFNGEVSLADAKIAGTQKENTTYTVPDDAKADVTYTFPSDAEEIVPGYEDYAGKTIVFEYDPDHSDTVDVTVEEGADTYIKLAYKIKRIPTDVDTSISKILFSEDGVGKAQWSSNNYEFMQDEESGVKHASFSNIGANPVTINIPNTSGQVVFEYDIMYKDLDYGGNYFGMTPYNGTTAGQGFGLRTSSDKNNQWQWAYRSGGDQYLPRTEATSDKGYSYYYNWRNQWAHMIVVCDGTQLKVTAANKDTGVVYLQDQVVPLANSVGTASRPINKVVFGRSYGSGEGTIGLANFKAYTVGAASGSVTETSASIKPADEISFGAASHISDMEGVEYDSSALIKATYELQDEGGNVVAPAGFALSSNGTLTTSLDSFDGVAPYFVVIKYNGVVVKKIKLNYLTKTLVTKVYKGFDQSSDGVSPFTLTSADGFKVENVDGTVKYTRAAGTANNDKIWLECPVYTEAIADDFVMKYDMKVTSSLYKGYLYLQDNSRSNIIKGETHFDEPRIKFFESGSSSTVLSSLSKTDWNHGEWYTFEYVGTNMSNDKRQIVLNVYNQGEETPIWSTTFTSVANKLDGLKLRFQVAQGSSTATDPGDEWYFDNLYYQYYDYK